MEKYHVLVVEDDIEIANAIKIIYKIKDTMCMLEMMELKV